MRVAAAAECNNGRLTASVKLIRLCRRRRVRMLRNQQSTGLCLLGLLRDVVELVNA